MQDSTGTIYKEDEMVPVGNLVTVDMRITPSRDTDVAKVNALYEQYMRTKPSIYDHIEVQRDEARTRIRDVEATDFHRYMEFMARHASSNALPWALVDAPDKATLTKAPAVTAEELSLDDPRRKLAVDAEMLLGYQPLLKDTKAPGRLRRALADLEIEVLDQISVDAYKVQMVRHYASHQKMSNPTWRIKPLRGYGQPVPEHVLAKAVEIKRVLPEAEFYVDQLAVDPFLIVSLGKIEDFRTNQPTRGLDLETAAYVEVWDEPKFEGRV